jgi:hypothetical protein
MAVFPHTHTHTQSERLVTELEDSMPLIPKPIVSSKNDGGVSINNPTRSFNTSNTKVYHFDGSKKYGRFPKTKTELTL